jgi:hypothetical protein
VETAVFSTLFKDKSVLTVEAETQVGAVPDDFKNVVAEPIASNDVVSAAVLYGIDPARPPTMFVAFDAVPVKAAVIVPALKLPELSLATIVLTVFAVAEFNPSNVSASIPEPVPSTVNNFDNTSAAV